MIKPTRGNLIEADAEALVNTVNCEGFMGKGIALQFKRGFPDNFKAYEKACRSHEVRPGRMFVYPTGSMINPKYIINFPTKRHWRENSRMQDIEAGLKALVKEIRELKVASVAVPPLGCGYGGLDWREVRPRIEKALAKLPDVTVMLYEPVGAPDAKAMPVKTKRPRMTVARAMYIHLMREYSRLSYRLTRLEIQKLAYFLQESGEPLKLDYVAHIYGPYAHKLDKALEDMEGHFIRGAGDSAKPDAEIELTAGAAEEAAKLLAEKGLSASGSRLGRVVRVIDGFETPYGLELLSSVHWVASRGVKPARSADDAIELVWGWSERKREAFKPEHMRVAWGRLEEQGWLARA